MVASTSHANKSSIYQSFVGGFSLQVIFLFSKAKVDQISWTSFEFLLKRQNEFAICIYKTACPSLCNELQSPPEVLEFEDL